MHLLHSADRRARAGRCRRRLVLQLRKPDGDWEQVDGRGEMLTIGSGPRCTVRLPAAGTRPLHCVIVNSPDGISVRRWSSDTRLNGRDFDSATLVVGDVLQVGPVEIDVLSVQEESSPWDDPFTQSDPVENCSTATPGDEHRQFSVPATEASEAAEEVFRQLRAGNDNSRRRTRRLVSALREDRQSRRELEERLEELEGRLALAMNDSADSVDESPPSRVEVAAGESPQTTPAICDESEANPSDVAVEIPKEAASDGSVEVSLRLSPSAEPLERSTSGPSGASRLSAPFDFGNSANKPQGEAYRALLADRLAQIEQLERELGIVGQPVSAEDANVLESQTVEHAPSGDEAPIPIPNEVADVPIEGSMGESVAAKSLGDIASDEQTEPQLASLKPDELPTGESERAAAEAPSNEEPVVEIDKGELATPPDCAAGTDTDRLPTDGDVVAPTETADVEWISALPAESPDESSENPQSASPVNEQRTSSFSSKTASFWGFAGDAPGVDDELLGPLARSSRASRRTPTPVLAPSSEVVDPPDIIHPGNGEAEQLVEEEAVTPPAEVDVCEESEPAAAIMPSRGKLPGAEPPAIPGLSDSAWAHLRELSIWREDAEDSDPQHGDPIETDESGHVDQPESPDPSALGWGSLPSAAPELSLTDSSDFVFVPAEAESIEPVVLSPVPHSLDSGQELGSDARGEPDAIEAFVEDSTNGQQPSNSPAEDSVPNEAVQTAASETPDLPVISTAFDPPPEKSPAGAGQSESFIDRYSHLFADESADSNEIGEPRGLEPGPEPESSGTSSPSESITSSQPTSDGAEEDSIDDYMAQLMRRIRGESTASTSPPAAAPTPDYQPPLTPAPGPTQQVAVQPAINDSESALPPLTLEEIRRSGPLPEKSTDMSALRDLANQTARSAIGAHASRMYRENAVSKLLVAGAAVASGMYLLATAPDLLSLQFVGACLAVLAALYWGTVIMRSLAESARAKHQSQQVVSGRDPFRPDLPIDAPAKAAK